MAIRFACLRSLPTPLDYLFTSILFLFPDLLVTSILFAYFLLYPLGFILHLLFMRTSVNLVMRNVNVLIALVVTSVLLFPICIGFTHALMHVDRQVASFTTFHPTLIFLLSTTLIFI